MSKRTPTDVAAPVRQRLLNLSKEKNEDFTLTLVRYAAERFLYYTLWLISGTFAFDGPVLVRAFTATFERRGTELPAEDPIGLTSEFGQAPDNVKRWTAFLDTNGLGDAPKGAPVSGRHAATVCLAAASSCGTAALLRREMVA